MVRTLTGPMTIQPLRGWQQQPIRQTPSKTRRTTAAGSGIKVGAAAEATRNKAVRNKATRKKSLKLQRHLQERACPKT
jgi:hypothetical protein